MQNTKRRVCVTGSNKGIGFGILEGFLSKEADFELIMTSRSIKNGEESIKNGEESIQKLSTKYSNKPKVHLLQLDLLDTNSIEKFVTDLKAIGKNPLFNLISEIRHEGYNFQIFSLILFGGFFMLILSFDIKTHLGSV